MTKYTNRKRLWFVKAVFLVAAILLCWLAPLTSGKTTHASAPARGNDSIRVHDYSIAVEIDSARRVRVHEELTVEFLVSNITTFYRALPVEQTRYFDISASCEGNEEFHYYVADNPDVSDFIDINCVGGVAKGERWTYAFDYTMENGWNAANSDDGMLLDVIPYGISVPLHNASVSITLPYATTLEHCKTYVGYGATTPTDLSPALSEDGRTFSFFVDVLNVHYVEDYDEWATDGVTFEFTMTGGSFDGYIPTRLFTDGLVWILLLGVVVIAAAIALRHFFRKSNDVIPVVNVRPPQNLDPMRMGTILDGTTDDEDVTSMIYYFADHGYLEIDFSDENDPVLRKKKELPESAPVYQKTLFDGLFFDDEERAVSELSSHYYESVAMAKKQLPPVRRYDKPSLYAYIAGGVLAVLYALLIGVVLSATRIGHGYVSWSGLAFVFPAALLYVIDLACVGRRYKWKRSALLALRAVKPIVALIFAAAYAFLIANHVATDCEKLLVAIFAFAAIFLSMPVLSRREDYVQTLGDIVGFKEFIVVTEKDKIEFMLQENPQLYYEVLPYAQVLGVTKEWEDKFADIVIEPPTWGCGAGFDLFDYMLINRCMHAAMQTSLARFEAKSGGSYIGKSGGGGHFGGFGGGGFGGGGFGVR